ncbi:MAG: chemotaxis protein CheW [Desulfamplus sp.]|nr:chemotaxis protein CheW [Desulfamplus sp.]
MNPSFSIKRSWPDSATPDHEKQICFHGKGLLMHHLMMFTIDDKQYAIDLFVVQRVVRAAALTPLTDVPETIAGLINVRGEILPVINMRICLNLPEKELEPSHQFIIASTSRQKVALWVDSVIDVRVLSEEEIVGRDAILPDTGQVDGAVICHDGMVLIYNLEHLLDGFVLSDFM